MKYKKFWYLFKNILTNISSKNLFTSIIFFYRLRSKFSQELSGQKNQFKEFLIPKIYFRTYLEIVVNQKYDSIK